MFKWIFLVQATVYFLLMPAMRQSVELGYHPPLFAGVLAIVSLMGGGLLVRGRSQAWIDPAGENKFRPKPILAVLMPILAGVYAFSTIVFGLINRRQGSEVMAELYSDLPLYVLGIVRGYEIIFVPIALLYAFSGASNKIAQWIVVTSLVVSLPFMGVADSRGRLLTLAIYMLCFVRSATFVKFLYGNARFLIATAVVSGAFIFYSIQRSTFYGSFNDFLFAEVYTRLDGLNLATDLWDAGFLDKIGQFDFEVFSPFISKIPFLDAARAAKLIGRTSTKQYYLQDILGTRNFDTPNSMILDPLYFGGIFGLICSFAILGYIIARVDRFAGRGALFTNMNKSVFALAFVMSFAVIENDMLGAMVAFVPNYILVALLLRLGTTRHDRKAVVLHSFARQPA